MKCGFSILILFAGAAVVVGNLLPPFCCQFGRFHLPLLNYINFIEKVKKEELISEPVQKYRLIKGLVVEDNIM